MKRSAAVANRLARVKGTVEDFRAAELAQAVRARDEVSHTLDESRGRRREAAAERTRRLSTPEWRLWDDYVRALEAVEARRQAELAALERTVLEKRDLAIQSYREAEVWRRLAGRLQQAERVLAMRRAQRVVDEQAAQRVATGTPARP